VKRYVDNTLGKLNVKTFFCTRACMRTLRVQLYDCASLCKKKWGHKMGWVVLI